MMTTTTNAPIVATPEMLPARICSEPGCKAKLGPTNSSGKCQEHRSHTKSNGNGAVAAANGNGHAVAGRANGLDRHPAGGNGAHNGAQQLAAERVKVLLADKDLCRMILDLIPLEDKIKFTAAWLSGRN